MTGFSEFWSIYPRKVAKKAAEKAFIRVTKRVSPARVAETLAERLKGEWQGREARFLPYPATFLNGESFEVEERCELLLDEAPEYHWHWCDSCQPFHQWQCFEEFCWLGAKAACRKVLS